MGPQPFCCGPCLVPISQTTHRWSVLSIEMGMRMNYVDSEARERSPLAAVELSSALRAVYERAVKKDG